jgi:hypothetical protein
MQKLILILLAFLAVFTFIRAFEKAEAGEIPVVTSEVTALEIPVEIAH